MAGLAAGSVAGEGHLRIERHEQSGQPSGSTSQNRMCYITQAAGEMMERMTQILFSSLPERTATHTLAAQLRVSRAHALESNG